MLTCQDEFLFLQWELVCDREWITATITTIQMGGLLFGGFISGQIADTYGRKLTYYLSLFVLLVFNAVAAFSTSWQMFATLRFFIGIGCGFYTTVFFTYLIEFTPRKYRSMIISIPSWPFWAIIFGLMSWRLHNWMFIQIATAVVTLPWFIGFK
jgi:OCT family organic cation transporter-like MFS transporter 4/5